MDKKTLQNLAMVVTSSFIGGLGYAAILDIIHKNKHKNKEIENTL